MASLNDQQAGRDAASFDDARKEGRFARDHFAEPSDWGTRPGDAEKQIALDAAMDQIERAFGKWDRAQGRFVPHAQAKRVAA